MKKFMLLISIFFISTTVKSQTDWERINVSTTLSYKADVCAGIEDLEEYDVKKAIIDIIGNDYVTIKLYDNDGVLVSRKSFNNVAILTRVDEYGNRNYIIGNKYCSYLFTATIESESREIKFLGINENLF